MSQLYVVSVTRMCMAAEAEAVVRFSTVVKEEDLERVPLKEMAERTAKPLADTGLLTNIRSMTPEEVEAWRKADPVVARDDEEEIEIELGKGVMEN